MTQSLMECTVFNYYFLKGIKYYFVLYDFFFLCFIRKTSDFLQFSCRQYIRFFWLIYRWIYCQELWRWVQSIETIFRSRKLFYCDRLWWQLQQIQKQHNRWLSTTVHITALFPVIIVEVRKLYQLIRRLYLDI